MGCSPGKWSRHLVGFSSWLVLVCGPLCGVAGAITPPPGYIYSPLPVGSATESCLAIGPGGTFVGIGPSFTANAQAVILARESGDHRLVALGFNSIADCVYDAANDVLYVTDNGGEIGSTGDTVFAVPLASRAAGLAAAGLELLPAGTLPFASSIAVDHNGDVLVGNATGGGAGTVTKIDVDAGPATSLFAAGLDFAGGIAVAPVTGEVLVADTNFAETRIRKFMPDGTESAPFAGPSAALGSFDLAFDRNGDLLVTSFTGAVDTLNPSGVARPFVTLPGSASGIAVDAFTGRVEIASGFAFTNDDRAIHRFTPVNGLVPGKGKAATECVHEYYGIELVAASPNKPAKKALCVDGDRCDADGAINGRCVFPVGFCFDVDDPRLPACSPSAPITAVSLSAAPFSAAVAEAGTRIDAGLPILDSSCFFTDGVTLPVKSTKTGKKAGKERIKVLSTTGDGRKDADTAILICMPAL